MPKKLMTFRFNDEVRRKLDLLMQHWGEDNMTTALSQCVIECYFAHIERPDRLHLEADPLERLEIR